jgi:hypothetical protein
MKRNSMQTVSRYARCFGGMLFLGFVLVGTAAASGPATLFKSLEVGVGPSSCLPQARAALPLAARKRCATLYHNPGGELCLPPSACVPMPRALGGCHALLFTNIVPFAVSQESSGALLQTPTTMLPRSVLAVGPASPSQYLRGGGTSDVLCFAQGLLTLPARNGPTSAAHMCVPGREPAGTSDLKEQLEQAVLEERYKDAARLRDLIKAQGVGPPAQTSGSGPPAGESTSDIRERLRQREISRLRDIDTDGDNMATPF